MCAPTLPTNSAHATDARGLIVSASPRRAARAAHTRAAHDHTGESRLSARMPERLALLATLPVWAVQPLPAAQR